MLTLKFQKKKNKEKSSILDFEKSIYQKKTRTETRTPSPTGEGWGEVFWERFEAKCIQYKFADTVFRYLVMVRYYYGAPLPDYLYEKYSPLTPEGGKDFIRFENFLAGTGNEFIGRGAPRSNTEAHIRHLKQMKNPVDILRSRTDGMSTSLPYVKGVVFPGKEFMVQKYSIKNSSIYFLYYPYRWWIGIKGMITSH